MVLNTAADSTVRIDADGGNDVVNVRAMAGDVTVNGGGENDTFINERGVKIIDRLLVERCKKN